VLNSSEICCIVVTYNPDEALEQLLKIIKNQVDQIIIVDNFSNINFDLEIRNIKMPVHLKLV
jgi:glycosyltransferase involved in cell wall biosynthesis